VIVVVFAGRLHDVHEWVSAAAGGWQDRRVVSRRVVRGGLVADGVAAQVRPADVLIEDGTIVAVGPDIGGVDAAVLDLAAGSVVCPGFVDAHVHAEGPLVADGVVVGALAQGVTTLVVGQDGSSWIGGTREAARYVGRYFTPVNGPAPADGPFGVGGFAGMVAGRLAQNVAVLASHGTIRYRFSGTADRPLEPAEVAGARDDVERALADGAAGLSSGLEYVPSRFGTAEEIAALAAPLAGTGQPYVSHLRGYGPAVRDGLAELIGVGARAGVRVHASHLWTTPGDLDGGVKEADDRGVEFSFDMYPYRRSSTILAMLLLPAELQAGGADATLRALADPDVRARLLGGEAFSEQSLGRLVLGAVPKEWAGYAGMTIMAAAEAAGRPAGPWTLDLLRDAELQVGAHLDRPSLTDSDLHAINTHPRHCAGSDGIYQGQHPHPRGYGTFARLTGHYTDAAGRTDYPELVRHLSTNPADAYGLRQRGRIAPGMAADLCILDGGGLADHATYTHPLRPATGVGHVFVNGELVWTNGALTTVRPGRLVSR
jgi:N-acyl-D-amino-acid deacylase